MVSSTWEALKVHPEEVDAVINRHPQVWMSLVRKRKKPVNGAIVVADVVLDPPDRSADQIEHCARELMARFND
jgi:acyl-coenzyme A synthetase/AMP-(fatty) acid ligase